jgi:hypothetical protein
MAPSDHYQNPAAKSVFGAQFIHLARLSVKDKNTNTETEQPSPDLAPTTLLKKRVVVAGRALVVGGFDNANPATI